MTVKMRAEEWENGPQERTSEVSYRTSDIFFGTIWLRCRLAYERKRVEKCNRDVGFAGCGVAIDYVIPIVKDCLAALKEQHHNTRNRKLTAISAEA